MLFFISLKNVLPLQSTGAMQASIYSMQQINKFPFVVIISVIGGYGLAVLTLVLAKNISIKWFF